MWARSLFGTGDSPVSIVRGFDGHQESKTRQEYRSIGKPEEASPCDEEPQAEGVPKVGSIKAGQSALEENTGESGIVGEVSSQTVAGVG